jgi:hypothetical protein
VALCLGIVGCSSGHGSPPDGGVDAPTGVDHGVDLPVDMGRDTPPSPWQIEFRDGTTIFWSVWGSGPNDVYAVGKSGNAAVIYHSAGDGHWTPQPAGMLGMASSVWGSGPNDVYVTVGGALLHSTGDGTWSVQTVSNVAALNMWGSSANDVYLPAGSGGVLHSTGDGTWTAQTLGGASCGITAIWGTSATNVYFAGGTGTGGDTPCIVHGPGAPTAETIPPLPDMYRRDIYTMWGSGPNDIYAVGNGNEIMHSTGDGTWTLQDSPPGSALGGVFEDVWGSGPNDVYVVGDMSGVAHSSGDGVWTLDPSLNNRPLGIWGFGPNDVYVVGDTIAHKKM